MLSGVDSETWRMTIKLQAPPTLRSSAVSTPRPSGASAAAGGGSLRQADSFAPAASSRLGHLFAAAATKSPEQVSSARHAVSRELVGLRSQLASVEVAIHTLLREIAAARSDEQAQAEAAASSDERAILDSLQRASDAVGSLHDLFD
jgi:hypothetical protein